GHLLVPCSRLCLREICCYHRDNALLERKPLMEIASMMPKGLEVCRCNILYDWSNDTHMLCLEIQHTWMSGLRLPQQRTSCFEEPRASWNRQSIACQNFRHQHVPMIGCEHECLEADACQPDSDSPQFANH